MDLKPKVVLKQKGDHADIPVNNLLATLSWQTAVDLDLYAFYQAKDDITPRKGFLGLFGGVKAGQLGKVYFMSRGKMNKFPWMSLDKDAGVGDKGGNNEENLRIAHLNEMAHILIAVNIFNKPNANFSHYGGYIRLTADDNQHFEVPLTATTGGNWCVIAHIDNTAPTGARLININKVQLSEPVIAKFI